MTNMGRAGVTWLSSGITYLTVEAVAADAFRPKYSYSGNFISDLGVPARSALAWLMNAGFCVQGTLFLAGFVLARAARRVLVCAVANAVGNVLIASCHSGSLVHTVGAVLAIVGGNAAILGASSIIGGSHRRLSLALGAFGLVSFALFVIDLQAAFLPIGLVERCSVYPITAWQLVTGAWLFSRRPTPWPGRVRRDERS